MKIKLRSNGQIIDPPLRVAQRYIRLGRASVYVEPVIEPVEESIIFREPEPVEVIIEKTKPKKKAKKKIEVIIESQVTERQEPSSEEVQCWGYSGDTE